MWWKEIEIEMCWKEIEIERGCDEMIGREREREEGRLRNKEWSREELRDLQKNALDHGHKQGNTGKKRKGSNKTQNKVEKEEMKNWSVNTSQTRDLFKDSPKILWLDAIVWMVRHRKAI